MSLPLQRDLDETSIGRELGHSEWLLIDQARIDGFAAATGDHQWLHVDPELAAASPFGGALAHGYLLLGVVPALLETLMDTTGRQMALNYGIDRLRFTAPVRAGSRVRVAASVAEAIPIEGGMRWGADVVLELEGSEKPALVARIIYLVYFRNPDGQESP